MIYDIMRAQLDMTYVDGGDRLNMEAPLSNAQMKVQMSSTSDAPIVMATFSWYPKCMYVYVFALWCSPGLDLTQVRAGSEKAAPALVLVKLDQNRRVNSQCEATN